MRQLDFRLAPAIVALFLILIGSQTGMAQTTTGEIRGTVTDVNGSAVAGASVIARNQDTNVENRTTTTGEGVYAIPNLIPGRYSIIVESPGFKRSITTDVSVNLGQITTVDVVLQPGGVQESVTGRREPRCSFKETNRNCQPPSNRAGWRNCRLTLPERGSMSWPCQFPEFSLVLATSIATGSPFR